MRELKRKHGIHLLPVVFLCMDLCFVICAAGFIGGFPVGQGVRYLLFKGDFFSASRLMDVGFITYLPYKSVLFVIIPPPVRI